MKTFMPPKISSETFSFSEALERPPCVWTKAWQK
jgi:hypothetical protein